MHRFAIQLDFSNIIFDTGYQIEDLMSAQQSASTWQTYWIAEKGKDDMNIKM
jgi:hypothetical protein